ncbi:hypothetical protein HELRODRAFT_180811 [Helobdella robusta]|uniref:Sin3 histone deacetylase corepressor complex component SDS3 n=1 Tax=Helobdella robusta TaxID=6412 RepID=T1FGB2_HELRO|nr:hypothetical protein HELRODRAFT_180811 [Helobdella robusta]ESN93495.1 hypothetical protein HELRODRAFT_180811 [Helobdella robusta]
MVSSSNDGENDLAYEDNDFRRDSDEDTEDASETEAEKKDEEFTGIKDQMFHDQLQQYKRQLHQLKNGTLPTYVKKLKKLEMLHGDRLHMNTLLSDIQMKIIEEEFKKEKLAAAKEFEDRKLELRDTLINELEHKKKTIELERQSMELTGDTMLVKPVTTRKLRRRPNDPAPVPEKRSKPSPDIFSFKFIFHLSYY